MDRIIEKPKWPRKKIAAIVAGIVVLAMLIVLVVAGSGGGTLKIEENRTTVGLVREDTFEESIPITGSVQPVQSIFITANEGGNVEEIFVEDGAMVERGDPLLRLSNSNLMLDFMNRETQIIEQINNLRNTRLTIEQNKRQLSDQLIDIQYQLVEAERQYRVDSVLAIDSAISITQHEASHNNIIYLRQKKDFIRRNIAREETIQNSQLSRIDASIGLMERNLEAIRQNLENLTVKAPIAGQLTGFTHFLGQTKNRGENLGQIDVMSGFLVRCQIDEFYLARVRVGQTAEFTFNGATHGLTITKVIPQVSNGQFTAEMSFDAEVPDNITRGQTVQIRLALSDETRAIVVPRGGFYQSTGGNWAFVLQDDGTARRQSIELGRQNTELIEVVSGLVPGDRVIINSYTNYGDAEILQLN